MKTTRSTHPVHPKIGGIGVQTILAASLWLAMIFTLSCNAANNPSALAGRWIGVSGTDDKDAVMELLSDGTGIVTKGSKGVAITWKTENGRFYVTAFGQAEAEDYKLQGSLLTFTDDKGKVSEYAKCKKDCKEAAAEYVKAKCAEVKKGSFTDSRDGKSYETVKIGNQVWMAENLNIDIQGSKCYEDNPENCKEYGRSYYYRIAVQACPKGWHLPSDDEWRILVDCVGSGEVGNISNLQFGWIGTGSSDLRISLFVGYWWSSTGYNHCMGYGYRAADECRDDFDKTTLSVRCLKD